jgi:hypothetical protein
MRRFVLYFAVSVAMSSGLLSGQTLVATETDAGAVPAIAPNDPTSIYALSGLDHVNLYNGSLNILIPLLKVGAAAQPAKRS